MSAMNGTTAIWKFKKKWDKERNEICSNVAQNRIEHLMYYTVEKDQRTWRYKSNTRINDLRTVVYIQGYTI